MLIFTDNPHFEIIIKQLPFRSCSLPHFPLGTVLLLRFPFPRTFLCRPLQGCLISRRWDRIDFQRPNTTALPLKKRSNRERFLIVSVQERKGAKATASRWVICADALWPRLTIFLLQEAARWWVKRDKLYERLRRRCKGKIFHAINIRLTGIDIWAKVTCLKYQRH